MEHSRLLKFLIGERFKNMSETPTIKIETDYENPPNISAEVPGEQKIRKMDPSAVTDTDITVTNTSTEVADGDFTLSPVITVTKNETALTKGDMKLQKVTVTEDIARQELENGGHKVYTEFQTTAQTDKQILKRTTMSEEYKETNTNNDNRSLENKRSRIPKLKFRQAVERVKRERREQKLKGESQTIQRRSSIPKLKDAKLVKRQVSLKHDWKPEEKQPEEKLEEEFDKIYEEIVDSTPIDIDDKILAVKIDDPEKIETKFEEIIDAYDSNDDTYLTQTEKLRASKIPGRKKNSDRSTKLGSLVDIAKAKSSTPNNNLKDGGFKVSATTVTTKRFSRGNSIDLNNAKLDGDIIKETIETETIERIPVITEITLCNVGKEINLNEPQSMEIDENIDTVHVSKTIVVEEDDSKLSKEITTRQIKSGIPVKPTRIKRGISKDLNKRPVSLDDRDFVNRKVVKHEELIDAKSQGIYREKVVTEKATGIEKPPRGISRTFSRDGKSITVTTKTKELSTPGSKIPVAETTVKENSNITAKDTQELEQQNEEKHPKTEIEKETLTTENITKESIKLGIPIYTKTTHSYAKGIVQNVEMSRTIEWKPAEIKIQRYGRSQSEYKPPNSDIIHKKVKEIVKDDSIMYEKSIEHSPAFTEIPNINTAIETQVIYTNNLKKTANVLDDTVNIASNKMDTDMNMDATDILKEDNHIKPGDIREDTLHKIEDIPHTEKDMEHNKVKEDKEDMQDKENIPKVTILKGNVNRLISQISVNDSKVVTKKELNGRDELPKKKSVLTKIAMFEGKDPAELNIKIKKCTTDNKRNDVNTKHEMNKINSSTRDFGNEPVIVDQIWKIREEDVQNVVHHKIEEVMILPEITDFTINENVIIETTSMLPGNLDLGTYEIRHEVDKLQEEAISDKILVEPNKTSPNLVVGKLRILPEQIDLDFNNTDDKLNIPAKIDIISNSNKEDIVKYLPEQVVSTINDDQRELEKPKVGKLDINFWKKQVEVNKIYVGTGKTIVPSPTEGNVNVLVEKSMTTSKQVTELPKSPTRIYINQDSQVEVPTILPARIDFTNFQNERPKILPGKLEPTTLESQLQVPVILPETPLMKHQKNNYTTQTSHLEIPVILPATIGVIKQFDTIQNAIDSPQENILHKASEAEVVPDLKDTNIKNNKITPKTQEESNKDIVSNNQTKPHDVYDEKSQINKVINKQSIISTNIGTVSAKIDAYESKTNEISSKTDFDEIHNVSTLPEVLKPLELEDNDVRVLEVPSDPDLVDSEPEIKETKETFMGKLKNKIYFFSNSNINSKKTDTNTLPENVISSVNDTNNNENDQINNTTEKYQNNYENNDKREMYKSFDDVGNIDFESKDEFKRTKSLAELDLGDIVKGQVQRMVYRIKSVDFDKPEVNKSNKINAKEMPKKSSVLEKIAMFEGKSGSNSLHVRRTKLDQRELISTNTKHSTDVSYKIPEEIFLQKVEDLSTAKLRYPKTQMQYIQLLNGHDMPLIALGTALMDNRLAPHIVSGAIDLGFRAIDTAMIYGNEKAIGAGIKVKIEDGTVERQDLFIISKLWSTYHHPDLVEKACRASLDALGLDYFDLYLIHNPLSFKEGKDPVPKIASVLQFSEYDYLDAWFAMEDLVRKGLVKNIGVSNFNSKQIQRILDRGRIRPVVNQVECHPYLSQERLQNFCEERNILLQCFGVLGAKGTPAEYKSPGVIPVLDDPLVKVMASALDVSAARLLISYQLQSGRPVVVSSSSARHLWDILQALTFQIKQHEVDALTALNKNERIYTYKGMGDTHKNYPFREPF